MNMNEFESRMYQHAANVEACMAAPLGGEFAVSAQIRRHSSRLKQLWLIPVAAAFLLGTTAFAVGNSLGWFAGREKEYSALPTRQEFVQDVGCEPVLIQRFENGYTFSRGYVENNRTGEAGDSRSFISCSFEYEKDGKPLWFTQEKSGFSVGDHGKLCRNYQGVALWYYCYINKFVPEGYEPTDTDRQAEAQGKLIITYGPEEIYLSRVSSLSWSMDGINYTLMQIDGELTAEELCAMAEEIIDGKDK